VSRPEGSWRKGSGCQTNTCVEVRSSDGLLWMRNSSEPEVTLAFTSREWREFRAALAAGEFDDLDLDPTL
jgi:hypothetical protein